MYMTWRFLARKKRGGKARTQWRGRRRERQLRSSSALSSSLRAHQWLVSSRDGTVSLLLSSLSSQQLLSASTFDTKSESKCPSFVPWFGFSYVFFLTSKKSPALTCPKRHKRAGAERVSSEFRSRLRQILLAEV